MLFTFRGGVRCESPHHTEKFLLFLLSSGEEMPLYTALKMGLIHRGKTLDSFDSKIHYIKIFCFESRYGGGHQQYSFYVRLDPDDGADITLKGFGLGAGGYIFQTRGEVLKKSEALSLLKPGLSYDFLSKQSPLSKMLRSQMRMIQYRESEDEPIRKIRTVRR